MRRLRVTFPTSLNEKDEALRAEVYWQEFKNVSMDYFEQSVNEAVGSCTFFPKPAELHEFMNVYINQRSLETSTREAIEWMKPTEEGKQIAKEIIGDLYKTWDEQDRKEAEERAIRFERNRAILKKQAKLLIKK